MRQPIDTAPRDGNVVILEDDAAGTYDVAHWSPEVGDWITEGGEPSKIAPSHWHPMPVDRYQQQEGEAPSRPSRARRLFSLRRARSQGQATSETALPHPAAPAAPVTVARTPRVDAERQSSLRRRFATASLAAALVVSVLTASYFNTEVAAIVTQYAGQPTRASHESIVTQGTQLPDQDSKTALLAPPQTEANQTSGPAQALVQPAAVTPVPEARQSLKDERAEALAQELAETRRALEGLDAQLRVEATRNAQSLEQERQKTAALAQEAAAARQELTAGTAQYRQELDDERARSGALASELATARREVEKQAALLKANDETGQVIQAEVTKSAQTLAQERQKTAALALEAAAARQEQTVGTAQYRQQLDEERARSGALASELATARREIEKQAALLKASDETGQLTQTEAAKSAQSLEQERQNAAALAQEATAARQELTAGTTRHRQELDEERARSGALASELATARREIEKQAAQLQAIDEKGQLSQTDATKSAQAIEQERQNAAALAQEVAAARQELTASMARHRQELDEERARSGALASKLAAAQRQIKKQAALSKANDKQAADGAITDPRQSPQQEFARTEAMARNVESARMALPGAVERQGSAEAPRLIARASALLGQGDIGAARIVLERGAETGSAQASFMLAETYDPAVLSRWRTYGTRGEVTKAREFYAKAYAGGIQEAKDRLNALHQ